MHDLQPVVANRHRYRVRLTFFFWFSSLIAPGIGGTLPQNSPCIINAACVLVGAELTHTSSKRYKFEVTPLEATFEYCVLYLWTKIYLSL